MKKAIFAILVILALLSALQACISPSERRQMEALLADYEQRNSQYGTLSTDTTRLITDFFESHGNDNQRLRAWYINGCALDGAGDAPQALDCFYKALDFADTTATDCDYKKLSRIHGQIATIFNRQHAPRLEIEAERKAISYSWKAKDTLSAIIFYEYLSVPYYFMGKKDSALNISENARKMYDKYGFSQYSRGALTQNIFYNLELSNYERASLVMKEYDSLFCKYDKFGNLIGEQGVYYLNKGMYYQNIGLTDSAIIYYNHLLMKFKDMNNTEAAYKGLMNVYGKLGMTDSIKKYTSLYCEVSDSSKILSANEEITRMNALHKYSFVQRVFKEKEKEAERYKMIAGVILLVSALGGYVAYGYSRKQKKQREENLKAINSEYVHLLKKFQQTQNDLFLIKDDIEQYHQTKEDEINELKRQLIQHQGTPYIMEHWATEQELFNSPIVKALHEMSLRAQKISNIQWKDLIGFLDKTLPDFVNKLNGNTPHLTIQEMQVAVLIRLQFTQGELAALLGVSKQRVNNLKRNINSKLFGENGALSLNDNIFGI